VQNHHQALVTSAHAPVTKQRHRRNHLLKFWSNSYCNQTLSFPNPQENALMNQQCHTGSKSGSSHGAISQKVSQFLYNYHRLRKLEKENKYTRPDQPANEATASGESIVKPLLEPCSFPNQGEKKRQNPVVSEHRQQLVSLSAGAP
jgi:hypothetical protein